MDSTLQAHFANIHATDRAVQNDAYAALLSASEQPVTWAYDVWDGLVKDLQHKDNHVRSIASQLLCNLAQSDPEARLLNDFYALFAVTYDAMFVTARHCLQNLWKVGLAGEAQKRLLVVTFVDRFKTCAAEKNCTLIRFDLLEGLRKLYDAAPDDTLRAQALTLIESEPDAKYRKKYKTLWKKSSPAND